MRRTRYPQLTLQTERLLLREKVHLVQDRVKTLQESLRTMRYTLKKASREGTDIEKVLQGWRGKLQINLDHLISEQPPAEVMEEEKGLWLHTLEKELNAKERWLRIRETELKIREWELDIKEKELKAMQDLMPHDIMEEEWRLEEMMRTKMLTPRSNGSLL